ncbi:MAG: translation initiation factor IF-1 [Deltaproteobacteria bacterium]|nr:translation initiation factor IF-1 [Deltaproteobacteria bacterium]
MSRDDLLKVEGVVLESVSGGQFSVKLVDGRTVVAKLSGKIRRFHIKVIVGDRVTVGLSPYDLSHGLILSREKLAPPPGATK